ncbi:hypothetical protein ACR9YC_07040 [Parasphingorhabdus sp. DH2-15]|uniref:hypothetical protein n=1 Tax=Parasphingorhabdus sp. DH2-15 TaxID=3444112 RepID=UPI003F686DC9
MRHKIIVLILAGLLGWATAAQPVESKNTACGDTACTLDRAVTIHRLIRLGRAEDDAGALLEAARLAQRYDVALAMGQGADNLTITPRETARLLLQDALDIARKQADIALQRRIRNALANADKGITPYALVRIFDLGPNAQIRLNATAEGGAPAILGATSDGGLEIKLTVHKAGQSAAACKRSGSLHLLCSLDVAQDTDLVIQLNNISRYSGTAYVVSN